MAGKNNENIRETGRQLAGSIGGSEPASTRNAHPDSSLPHRAHAQEKDQVVRSELGRHISIAVDPVALVTTECITVTSAMRKHARWAHSSVSMILGGGPSMARDISQLPRQTGQRQQRRLTNGSVDEDDTLANRWGLRGKKGKSMQDQPLLSAFTRLRNDLRGCTGQRHCSRYRRCQANDTQIYRTLTCQPSSTLSSKLSAPLRLLPLSPPSQLSPSPSSLPTTSSVETLLDCL